MAVARAERLTFAYPGALRPSLCDVSLTIEAGERVLLLGPSGSGKSTLLRAFAGLVPHFHGGRFAGRVEVGGLDTRTSRPAALAGTVATVFQNPEEQVVMTRVAAEVAFGLENLGVEPSSIAARAREALAAVGAQDLAERRTFELSAGELQRVCLASALALEPSVLLLDEPTSQLDPAAADAFLERACGGRAAVVLAEQRAELPLDLCDRVVFLEAGRIVLDAPRDEALAWLGAERSSWLSATNSVAAGAFEHERGALVCRATRVSLAFGERLAVDRADLELRRGEVVALTGPNGSGKTTLAKLAAGLLEPDAGEIVRTGRVSYLAQDPGRYVVCERADQEVALGVDGDLDRARAALAAVGLAGFEDRHPRDLSTGERERLALAAVLVTAPDVLILDEPTRGVDPVRKEQLAALIRGGRARRATLVVTHDRLFAEHVADRELSFHDGALVPGHRRGTRSLAMDG
ncbi:MAG: ATP-binding cassette domain-containing protein [Thermoleophilia bacterium]|nr:ATP-binding cassette domain-containing protein [Thermoleophilia bacterium]